MVRFLLGKLTELFLNDLSNIIAILLDIFSDKYGNIFLARLCMNVQSLGFFKQS
jgi:hypothetical protein